MIKGETEKGKLVLVMGIIPAITDGPYEYTLSDKYWWGFYVYLCIPILEGLAKLRGDPNWEIGYKEVKGGRLKVYWTVWFVMVLLLWVSSIVVEAGLLFLFFFSAYQTYKYTSLVVIEDWIKTRRTN